MSLLMLIEVGLLWCGLLKLKIATWTLGANWNGCVIVYSVVIQIILELSLFSMLLNYIFFYRFMSSSLLLNIIFFFIISFRLGACNRFLTIQLDIIFPSHFDIKKSKFFCLDRYEWFAVQIELDNLTFTFLCFLTQSTGQLYSTKCPWSKLPNIFFSFLLFRFFVLTEQKKTIKMWMWTNEKANIWFQ